MKSLILGCVIFLSYSAFSQDYFHGLFAKNYLETSFNSDKTKRINQSISLVYNTSFCRLDFTGKDYIFFKTRGYQTKMQGEFLVTDFLSEETETTPDGYYGIMIDENKNGVTFQISLPDGTTFLADKVEKFNENGKVEGNIQIDWKTLEKNKAKEDSIMLIKQKQKDALGQQQKRNDSMFVITRDSLKSIIEDSLNSIGKQEVQIDTHVIKDTIEYTIKTKGNEHLAARLKVHIDSKGFIDYVESIGNDIGTYLSSINQLTKGIKLQPFIAKNGKSYPCYTLVNVTLTPEVRVHKN